MSITGAERSFSNLLYLAEGAAEGGVRAAAAAPAPVGAAPLLSPVARRRQRAVASAGRFRESCFREPKDGTGRAAFGGRADLRPERWTARVLPCWAGRCLPTEQPRRRQTVAVGQRRGWLRSERAAPARPQMRGRCERGQGPCSGGRSCVRRGSEVQGRFLQSDAPQNFFTSLPRGNAAHERPEPTLGSACSRMCQNDEAG